MSGPQSIFGKETKEALESWIKKLKGQRDNPAPTAIGLTDQPVMLPMPIFIDYQENALPGEHWRAFLLRRFEIGYEFKDGKWGKGL